MMAGTLIMEDHVLTYTVDGDQVTYTVADGLTGKNEKVTVDMPDFFAALAIALHPDGNPNGERDYVVAEKVQPSDPALRWIP